MKVIIRFPNWLGDCVMALPVLSDVRQKWPDAFITVMLPYHLAGLIEKDPRVDEVFGFHRPSGFLRRQADRQIIGKIAQGKYDLGILLTNSFSSAYLFWRGNVKKRVGYRGRWRTLLLTDPVAIPIERDRQHLVLTYKELLRGCKIEPTQAPPLLYVTEEEKSRAGQFVLQWNKEVDTVIGMNTTAAFGPAKCWPKERFVALCLQLLKKPTMMILLFGDRNGIHEVEEIVKKCVQTNPEYSTRLINLAGKTTLRELIAFLAISDVVVSNDSGPMHLAAALGRPLVAIFGSTNPKTTGPYETGTVIYKGVKCSPCYLRHCPIDFRCMKQIEVKEVFDAVTDQLSFRKTGRRAPSA